MYSFWAKVLYDWFSKVASDEQKGRNSDLPWLEVLEQGLDNQLLGEIVGKISFEILLEEILMVGSIFNHTPSNSYTSLVGEMINANKTLLQSVLCHKRTNWERNSECYLL